MLGEKRTQQELSLFHFYLPDFLAIPLQGSQVGVKGELGKVSLNSFFSACKSPGQVRLGKM